MSVVVLMVFVSLMLVCGGITLFIASVRQKDHQHHDRLSLAPLEEDLPCNPAASNTTTR